MANEGLTQELHNRLERLCNETSGAYSVSSTTYDQCFHSAQEHLDHEISAITAFQEYINKLDSDQRAKYEQPLTVKESRLFLEQYSDKLGVVYCNYGGAIKSTDEMFDCEEFQQKLTLLLAVFKADHRVDDTVWHHHSKHDLLNEIAKSSWQSYSPDTQTQLTTPRSSSSYSSSMPTATSRSSRMSSISTFDDRTCLGPISRSSTSSSKTPPPITGQTVANSPSPTQSSVYSFTIPEWPKKPLSPLQLQSQSQSPPLCSQPTMIRPRQPSSRYTSRLPSPEPCSSIRSSRTPSSNMGQPISLNVSALDDGSTYNLVRTPSARSILKLAQQRTTRSAPGSTKGIEFARKNKVFQFYRDEVVGESLIGTSTAKMAKPAKIPHARTLIKKIIHSAHGHSSSSPSAAKKVSENCPPQHQGPIPTPQVEAAIRMTV